MCNFACEMICQEPIENWIYGQAYKSPVSRNVIWLPPGSDYLCSTYMNNFDFERSTEKSTHIFRQNFKPRKSLQKMK